MGFIDYQLLLIMVLTIVFLFSFLLFVFCLPGSFPPARPTINHTIAS